MEDNASMVRTYGQAIVIVENDMIIRLAEAALHTLFGTFQEVLYYDGQQESIALVRGQVEQGQEILCRMRSSCLAAHVFNSLKCDCREQMALAQALIERPLRLPRPSSEISVPRRARCPRPCVSSAWPPGPRWFRR
jgi:hypothetical protein